jgi:hypothetical protein
MKSNNILIFGLGHLASFLVRELDADADIWGTYRSQVKDPALARVNKVRFDTTDDIPVELSKDWGVVIWNLPPHDGYMETLKEFNSKTPESCPWIFISSTSVYSDGDIDEDSKKDGVTRNGALLTGIESQLLGFSRQVLILRPGGLVDSTRNPVNFLKEKSSMRAADTPVNLVHTQDVARFMAYMIKMELYSQDYNLVSDDHPGRALFYSQIMACHNLTPPKWSTDDSVHRLISNRKSKSTGFNYLHPNLLEYFKSISNE